MNKIPILLGILLTPALHASPVQCITQAIYQEARGVNAEEMAMVGHTIINQHKRTKDAICRVTRKGYQSKTPPPKTLQLYEHVARGLLSGAISDMTGGADHFNEGRKPRWPGKIKRVTRHFVFYRLEER